MLPGTQHQMQSSPLPAIMTCVKSVLHVLFICLLGAVSLYMKKVPGDMFKFFNKDVSSRHRDRYLGYERCIFNRDPTNIDTVLFMYPTKNKVS